VPSMAMGGDPAIAPAAFVLMDYGSEDPAGLKQPWHPERSIGDSGAGRPAEGITSIPAAGKPVGMPVPPRIRP
jgi:hypothetical protein